jgi:hypothetical protein
MWKRGQSVNLGIPSPGIQVKKQIIETGRRSQVASLKSQACDLQPATCDQVGPEACDSLFFLEYGIQVFEKFADLLLQLGSDLGQPQEEFFEPLPIEFKPVSLPE